MLGHKKKSRLALGMAAVWLLMLPGCTWRAELFGGGEPVETQPVQIAPDSTDPEEEIPETERLYRLTQRAARVQGSMPRLRRWISGLPYPATGDGMVSTQRAPVTYETVENSSHFRLSVEEESTRWWDAGTRYQFSQKAANVEGILRGRPAVCGRRGGTV